MKTRMILAALLLMAFGTARAQENSKVNTVVVNTIGDVTLVQGLEFHVEFDMDNPNFASDWNLSDSILTVNGTGDFIITIPELNYLTLASTGDVLSKGTLQGDNLRIESFGTGDIKLSLNYENVYTLVDGTGDVILSGESSALFAEVCGSGDFKANTMRSEVGVANVTGFGDCDLGTIRYNAYYSSLEAIYNSYEEDDGRTVKYRPKVNEHKSVTGCQQGKPIDFIKKDNHWKIDGSCDVNDDKTVDIVLQNAAPFFAQQTHNTWDKKGDVEIHDLDKLMQNYYANMEKIYDSINWKRLEEEMTRAFEEYQREYDSIDWESIEKQMKRAEKEMEEWGRRMEEWGRQMEKKYDKNYECRPNNPYAKKDGLQGGRPLKKNLLLDANWNGFDAGLNMLFGPTLTDVYVPTGGGMELRPLRSWYFGFNIADVGVAFNRRHTAGLFTGIGIGWNNYSWNHDIIVMFDPDNVIYTVVPIETDPDHTVKTSKYGALFLQAPLMIEVRPTNSMYIDMGVTAGLRIAQWNRVKYSDGSNVKKYFSGPLNQFKLDASLRIGGENIGFFANYALLPIFSFGNQQEAHPVSFGFSIVF